MCDDIIKLNVLCDTTRQTLCKRLEQHECVYACVGSAIVCSVPVWLTEAVFCGDLCIGDNATVIEQDVTMFDLALIGKLL